MPPKDWEASHPGWNDVQEARTVGMFPGLEARPEYAKTYDGCFSLPINTGKAEASGSKGGV